MKRLLLLRHAKAAPGDGYDDFGRELTESGGADAAHMGDFIAGAGLTPDVVVYSGARRTRETAEIVIGRLGRSVETIEENAIYEATRHLILALLRRLPDNARSVMVVGHNPAWGTSPTRSPAKAKSRTACASPPNTPLARSPCSKFDGPSWANLSAHEAKLDRFVTPADLGLR